MREKHKTLTLYLDSRRVAELMYQDGVLALRELESIHSKPTMSDSNEELLRLIKKHPILMMDNFLAALRKTKQNRIYFSLIYTGVFQLYTYYISYIINCLVCIHCPKHYNKSTLSYHYKLDR